MGGCTLTTYGRTIRSTLKDLKRQILEAFPTLQADSDVVLLKTTAGSKVKESHIYKVIYAGKYGMSIRFHEVKAGKNIDMPLAVSAHYQRKPRRNEWLGTVHLHT